MALVKSVRLARGLGEGEGVVFKEVASVDAVEAAGGDSLALLTLRWAHASVSLFLAFFLSCC